MTLIWVQVLMSAVLVLHMAAAQDNPTEDDAVWDPWTPCSVTCGGGMQERNGTCIDPDFNIPYICFTQKGECGQVPCDDEYADSVWTECSVSCGSGERSRTNIHGDETQTIRCNTQSCSEYAGDCAGDIVLVLDSSGSIDELNWFIEKQFAIDVIKGLKVDPNETHVGVISYSTQVEVILDLGESYDINEIEAKIWNSSHMAGLTSITAVLNVMRQVFNESGRDDTKHIVIFVSDAVPNVDYNDTIPEANAAKAEGAIIFFVGSGHMDYDMMVELASSPPETFVLNATSIYDMQDLTQYLDNQTCSEASDVLPITLTSPGTTFPTLPFFADCSTCDYATGQIWLPDFRSCHSFILCEPVFDAYVAHEMSCGALYWSQELHTCVLEAPAGLDCTHVTVTVPATENATMVPCPFEPHPNDSNMFWIPSDSGSVQICQPGMIFMVDECTCITVAPKELNCTSDMLLHFPFDDHFNDVTCTGAISTVHGDVSIESDVTRGNVACFNGSDHLVVMFMRQWFANQEVEEFSIGVWVKRAPGGNTRANIVQNGVCESPSFHVTSEGGELYGGIKTDAELTVDGAAADNGEWHHATWVYDGAELRFYINGILTEVGDISGFIASTDSPMVIGQCCELGFTGCMDELRMYERVLSAAEITGLSSS